MNRKTLPLLLVLALVALLVAACGETGNVAEPTLTQPALAAITRTATRSVTPTRTVRASTDSGGLPLIARDELPPEAVKTIALIQKGGPFPYRQDGIVFENRERLLPNKPSGYYHEYTVVTPGSPDRGARRIITGKNGELYYTDDHYASFKRITE